MLDIEILNNLLGGYYNCSDVSFYLLNETTPLK